MASFAGRRFALVSGESFRYGGSQRPTRGRSEKWRSGTISLLVASRWSRWTAFLARSTHSLRQKKEKHRPRTPISSLPSSGLWDGSEHGRGIRTAGTTRTRTASHTATAGTTRHTQGSRE